MRVGAVAVPVNHKFPDETLQFVLRDADISIVFSDAKNLGRLATPYKVIGLDAVGFRGFLRQGVFQSIVPHKRETGLVLFTSGSTGRPKGVALSHASQRSMVNNASSRLLGVKSTVAAPLYHMNALLMSFMLLDGGGTIVLMPRFSARDYLNAIHRYRVDLVSGVPTMLTLMAKEIDLVESLDLGCVVGVVIGSAPLSETVFAQTEKMFPNARISNGYGTTEAGAGIFGQHPGGVEQPMMALGYPTSHVEVRLVGGSSADQGILQVKTPAAMNGYLNAPEKTAAKFSADGWIDTGDVMRRDDQGFYYFIGRDDDMFVCGGENVYPGEVERVISKDGRIAEACVIPVNDSVRGQMPVAFVTLSGDVECSEQDVKQMALDNAPPYMHPRRVWFLDEMPLAGTNKIDRAKLTRLALNYLH